MTLISQTTNSLFSPSRSLNQFVINVFVCNYNRLYLCFHALTFLFKCVRNSVTVTFCQLYTLTKHIRYDTTRHVTLRVDPTNYECVFTTSCSANFVLLTNCLCVVCVCVCMCGTYHPYVISTALSTTLHLLMCGGRNTCSTSTTHCHHI